MIGLDEVALRCDFAEVYHVLDWRVLPAHMAAALALGLGPDSRIMRKMCGVDVSTNTLLLAIIADALRILVWQNTKDAACGRNKPTLITDAILSGKKESAGFDTIEEFNKWRSEMLGSDNDGD